MQVWRLGYSHKFGRGADEWEIACKENWAKIDRDVVQASNRRAGSGMAIRVRGTKTVQRRCPRCQNDVDFELARDETLEFGLLAKLRADFWGVKSLYRFRLKCPICIYEEGLSLQMAYSLMES